jgi:hypothetical protein
MPISNVKYGQIQDELDSNVGRNTDGYGMKYGRIQDELRIFLIAVSPFFE